MIITWMGLRRCVRIIAAPVGSRVGSFGLVPAMYSLFAALVLISMTFHTGHVGVPLSPPAAASPVEPESGNEHSAF